MPEIARYRLEIDLDTYEQAQAIALDADASCARRYVIRALDADGNPLYTPEDEAEEDWA